eukprot:TRINITY_DN36026_c0_g1_i1.p1 TRINITY_DN36026_c0_g1~~TRINITY_DN36026_c0_g1_i1.p1  ORF type:complete len:286 (+),score=78.53 TRINITY_DN36026_c0_g1_i1:45-902(+)
MASQGAQRGALRATTNNYSAGEQGSEFPILCETCLGPNRFVRMIKCQHDKQCHVCERPMNVFRWKPGMDSRYKSTVLCQTCSKLKNVCQCCIYDLEYGLPVAVRDHYAKGDALQMHQSDVQREYFAQQNEVALANGQLTAHQSGASKQLVNPNLQRLARQRPNYDRNRAHICSFFVKGECRRGKECPYRHEMPKEGELANQRIKDRYFGSSDPVADKIMRLERQREEAVQQQKKLLSGYDDDEEEEFDPSKVAPPPGAPPKVLKGSAGSVSIPAYPSTSKNWLGD